MPTFKAVIHPKQFKGDGTARLKIRVTHKGVQRYLKTEYYVKREDLTRSLNLKSDEFLSSAQEVIEDYKKICRACGTLTLDKMDVDEVRLMLETGNVPGKIFRLNFIEYARKIANSEPSKGNGQCYHTSINALERFVGSNKLDISEITSKFIKDFIKWINDQPAAPNRTKGQRAQSLYPSNIRAIHNRAKAEFNDEDAGIINIPQSPFSRVTLPPIPRTRKRAIPVEKLRKIAALPDREIVQRGTNRYNLARDIFMLSFYLVGMNTVDMFNATEYEDGRISYRRQKTRSRRQDEAFISIKVESEVIPIIEKYRDKTGKRVFCFYAMYANSTIFNDAVNRGLKIIGTELDLEDLEHGAARHSVATIARNKCGISKDDVDMMLNHVIEKNKVADIYIDQDWTIIDNAQRKVIDYFIGKTHTKNPKK